jgi:hypothetical protein
VSPVVFNFPLLFSQVPVLSSEHFVLKYSWSMLLEWWFRLKPFKFEGCYKIKILGSHSTCLFTPDWKHSDRMVPFPRQVSYELRIIKSLISAERIKNLKMCLMNAVGSYLFMHYHHDSLPVVNLRVWKSPLKLALNAKLARREVRQNFQLAFHNVYGTKFRIYMAMAYVKKN